MALVRLKPCRGYQIHVDYQVGGQMVSGSQLDCHEKKKLAKHHVEDGEDYNGEERRHLYIDYHHLLHQSLFHSLNLSTLIHDLKRNENTKEKKKKILIYNQKKETQPNSPSPPISGLFRGFYRHTRVLEDETSPRVENRHVGPPNCRRSQAFAAFSWQNQGLRSLVLARNFS